ncbi:MAG: ATP-binding protein [Candidatus Aminicenantes bacterium]|nr:ATP-binding protein [Candidatus Aminicenantes bacterium]
MINRVLEKKLKQLRKQFPVLTLTGPRQSGKTTLVKHAFNDLEYVSLEDIDNREFALEDPRGFLATYTKGVIIDEAQRVPGIFSYIQSIVDRHNKPGMFILTGSQNFLLNENISQTLSGRAAVLKLLPFSIEELAAASFDLKDYRTALFYGFYPRIYDFNIAPGDWHPSYVQTYLERDVRQVKKITDLALFQRFLRLCAGRTGQILNLSSLALDCGVSHNTVNSWLSVLETSYIIFLLKPHHKNFNKRLIKMPKLYFFDPGLACYLLGIESEQQLQTHYLRGALFESMIISEFFKYRFNRGRDSNCYFWRDKTGHEIDCIIEDAGRLIPVEIKSGETVKSNFFDGLKYWNNLSGQSPEQSVLVYGGEKKEKRSSGTVLGWQNTTDAFKY